MEENHTIWINRATELAWKGTRKVFPNPMVGAVLVKNQQIIGEGYHHAYGSPHAEIEALKTQSNTKGATLYVTLEPCCHHGKTPPCTEAILKAQISHVVYALKDPNLIVSGKGIDFLEKNNIKTSLFFTNLTKELNHLYLTQITKKRPFIHLKNACTLDGKLTLQKNHPTPLTNQASNKKTHQLRAQYDAILVGIETVLIDNPKLTVRHTQGKNPIKIILDSQLRTPTNALLLTEPGQTIIATTKTTKKTYPKKTYPKNTTILLCKKNHLNQIDLFDLLDKLFNQNIGSILVEGGFKISESFLKNNLVDRLTTIYTPYLANQTDLPSIPQIVTNKLKTATLTQNNLWVDLYLTC